MSPTREKTVGSKEPSVLESLISERRCVLCGIRYDSIFESTCEGILLIDKNLTIVDANSRACELFGHKKDDLCGMHTDQLQPDHSRIQRAGGKERLEAQALKPDGRVINVEVTLSRFVENDTPLYLAIVRDITGHKRELEKLNEREETVRSIVNAAVEPMMLLDPDGRIVYLNQSAAMSFDSEPDELFGMDSFALLGDESATQRRNYAGLVMQWSMPVRFEEQLKGKTFETSIHPVFGKDGVVERLAVFSRDATLEKKKAAILTEQEHRFRSIFNSLSSAAILIDGEAAIVREANGQAQRVTNMSRDNLLGMHISELFDDKVYNKYMVSLDSEHTAGDGGRHTLTTVLHSPGSGRIDVLLHIRNIWISDKPYVLLEFQGISDLKILANWIDSNC